MTTPEIALCIAGMMLVTYIPRALPLTLLASRPLNPVIVRWLSFVPASVLAALLAPDLLLRDGVLYIAPDNIYLLAAIPAGLTMHFTGSFFGTVAVGMGAVAAGRYLLTLV